MSSPLHQPTSHESAVGHVTGGARYVDDLPTLPGSLVGLTYAWIELRNQARAILQWSQGQDQGQGRSWSWSWSRCRSCSWSVLLPARRQQSFEKRATET